MDSNAYNVIAKEANAVTNIVYFTSYDNGDILANEFVTTVAERLKHCLDAICTKEPTFPKADILRITFQPDICGFGIHFEFMVNGNEVDVFVENKIYIEGEVQKQFHRSEYVR